MATKKTEAYEPRYNASDKFQLTEIGEAEVKRVKRDCKGGETNPHQKLLSKLANSKACTYKQLEESVAEGVILDDAIDFFFAKELIKSV